MNKPCVAIEPHTINDLTRHRHERRRIYGPHGRSIKAVTNGAGRAPK
jgi:hypothetical protein